jgi:tRNA modifying enzyme MnmG/GidA C-terminal domain
LMEVGLGSWAAAMEGGRPSDDAHHTTPTSKSGSSGTPVSDDETVAKMGHPASASDLRLPAWVRNEMKTVETEIKYSGYLDQQRRSMEKMRKAERRGIPEWFDYKAVSGCGRGRWGRRAGSRG